TDSPLTLRFVGPNPLRSRGLAAEVQVTLGARAPAADWHLRVFDAGGRLVRDLGRGSLSPGGAVSVTWRGDAAGGRSRVPGLYFLALEGGGRRSTVRVALLR